MFVPERGAAALKVTAHCTDLRKRNCLGVPERGRKLLVRAAAVRHVVRLRPRTEPVPSGKQPGTVSAALSVRPAFGSCSHATAATPATSELKPVSEQSRQAVTLVLITVICSSLKSRVVTLPRDAPCRLCQQLHSAPAAGNCRACSASAVVLSASSVVLSASSTTLNAPPAGVCQGDPRDEVLK
nr:uncharacterized protein LOC110356209 isoform X1 [Columba livia]